MPADVPWTWMHKQGIGSCGICTSESDHYELTLTLRSIFSEAYNLSV